MTAIRVVVVDDSPLIRQIFVDMLRREGDIEVVGYARDGEEALLRIAELNPDVVTLDAEMPRLGGLGCLRELMATRPVPAVMVSTPTPDGIAATLEALALGAVDFVCKPDSGSLSTLRGVREEFVEKVRLARRARVSKALRVPVSRPEVGATDRVCLVAGSAGGVRALEALFQGLPQGFSAPMLVSQRLPEGFVGPLARRLNGLGATTVREARPGDRMEPGLALLTPAGRILTVREDGRLDFEDGPACEGADRLFASAAEVLGERCVVAVVSGQDGAAGALAVRRVGGTVLAEGEETCTVYEAPRLAIDSGAAERTVAIDAMAEALAEAVLGKVFVGA